MLSTVILYFPALLIFLHWSSLGIFAKHSHQQTVGQPIKVSNPSREVYHKENTENPCPGLVATLQSPLTLAYLLPQATVMVIGWWRGLGLSTLYTLIIQAS